MPTPKKLPRRIPELDSLRGLAAFAVVLYHYTVRYDVKIGHVSAPLFRVPFGHYGVELFFLLSGFVIFMTLERTRRGRDFVISRFSRLYPGYWVGAAVTLAAIALFGAPFENYSLSTADIAANATMLQRYVPGAHNIDGAYWTLGVELTFYGLIFGLFLIGGLRRIRTAIVCLLAIAVGLHYLTNGGHISAPLPLRVVRKLFLEHYAPYFAAGILYYKLYKEGPSLRDLGLVALCLGAAALMRPGADAIASVIAFAIFGLLTWGKLRWLASRPLMFLGAISYSLYVVHQNIGYLVIRHATNAGISTNVAISLAILVSIAIATMITFWIERPSQRLMRSWFKRQASERPLGTNQLEPAARLQSVDMTPRSES